jgi:putative nucleotidyltransferase with HDIG domain
MYMKSVKPTNTLSDQSCIDSMRYKALMSCSEMAIFTVDATDYHFTSYGNDSTMFFQYYYNVELYEGIKIEEVFQDQNDQVSFWIAMFEKTKMEGEHSFTSNSPKTHHHLKVTMKPVVYNNVIIEILILFSDLSKLVEYELQKQEEYEKFKAVMDNTSDHIYLVDVPNFNIIYRNKASIEFIKRMYNQKDVDIKNSSHLTSEQKQWWNEKFAKVLEKKKLEFSRTSFVGNAVLDFKLEVLNFNEKQVIMVFSRDITETVEYQQKLMNANQKIFDQLMRSIQAISKVGELRDLYTAGHQRRVDQLAHAIAKKLNLDEKRLEIIHMGSIIHDIGKMYIPYEILSKPDTLTEHEMGIVKTHPQKGHEIIKDIGLPHEVSLMVLQHHERLDGSGYPFGLKADGMILESKILAVADVVEAISSHRPYRPALGIDVALDEIIKYKGIKYDEVVVNACLSVIREDGFEFDKQ